MLGKRGGKALRDQRPQHLCTISPLGRVAAAAAREGRKALKVWKQRQSHPQTYEDWQQDLAAWPQQEQMPKDFMAW